MKLTTLEIKGFKSFADKTTLHFNESITGVVGPNGCGKSNIVDAIRWVLGEQKPTAIRTEKMENLIFNGTKARKASGLAEVSLTFENTRNLLATEFSTVTISRHYYKTGESEYRINGIPCRLKDITGLFMDTGISTDSYAIIELGMLDDVLHNKDNSRRRLFEQASGISKYKIRKKETINKLNLTQQDLDRVEDILFEIENNLKDLEKQARKAQRHQKLKAEYKANSIDLAVLMLQSHKDIYKQLANQQTYESDAKTALETEIKQLEASIAEKKAALIRKEQELSQGQKAFNELLDDIRQKENLSNLNKERLKFLEERKVQLLETIATSKSTIEDTRQSVAELEQKAATEKESLELLKGGVQEKLRELEEAKSVNNKAHEELRTAQDAYKKAESFLYDTDKQLTVNKVRLENFARELENLKVDKDTHSNKLEPLQQLLTQQQNLLATAREKLEMLFKEEASLKEAIESRRESIEQRRKELADINREKDARQNEYNLVKNMFDSLEGYPESIRYIRKEIPSMQHAPLLSDIISTEDSYKAAIEAYLEPWLNHYIVDDMGQAIAVVNELEDKKKGRASFLVLNECKPSDHKAVSADGSVPALRVVQADSKYSNLVSQLLGHVYISTGADFQAIASGITRQAPGAHVMHHTGKVVSSGKIVSGGSVGAMKGNRLGTEKNLKRLSEAVDKLNTKAEELQAELDKEQQVFSDNRMQLNALPLSEARDKVSGINEEIAGLRAQIEHAGNTLTMIDEKQTGFHEMISKTEAENTGLQEAHAKLEAEKEEKHKEMVDKESVFRATMDELNKRSDAYNKENVKYHQQQNVFQAVSRELDFKQTRLEEATRQHNQGNEQLVSVEEEQVLVRQKNEELSEELIGKVEARKQMETEIADRESAFYAERGVVAETEDKIKALQHKKENSDQILGSIKDRLNDLKVELAATKERLWVEFQVELDHILDNDPPEGTDLDTLREKVAANKRRLENFGEVNPMAVQAFEEMNNRYEFIKTQREDLLEAKTSLLTTIEEIDQTAKEKFDDTFNQVRTNFVEVFRTLFTENDDCDLLLKEGYDPLNADVEIIAKPKGKKPQVIDQLSGGEKTLTAMALLFALYLIKPAPFCILDEVDAPLDDNNIMKFNNMIRRFSGNSQFIIVTHNKRTMSQVDVIYGVTMAEQGISKVVPVDFRNVA